MNPKSPPGAAEPCVGPEGQRLPRAGFMSPSQSAISRCGWGFHTVRDNQGLIPNRPRVRRNLALAPRGNTRRMLALAISRCGWDFHAVRGGIV